MVGKKLTLFDFIVGIAAIVACVAAVLVVPEFRQWAGLQQSNSPNVQTEPSPLTSKETQTPLPYVTPLDAGSGETVDDALTAHVLASPTTAPQELTAIPTQSPIPRIYNFSACKDPCNGRNSTTTFQSAITKIYVEWDYENIPYGAHYVRKWTMNGREWIKYDCTWTGRENGRDSVKLTEPKGLHSGTWQLTITVADDVLLNEQVNISGNWDYWDPAGTLTSCYGTTN